MRFASAILVCALAALAAAPDARAQQPMPPGQFDYYLLALSWSPSYCAHHAADPAAREECDKRRGFVVHGLWPQNERGPWPAFCIPVATVPPALAARAAAIMPNVELIEHEWAKHGSCGGLAVGDYFAAIERAFAGLRLPDALAKPATPVRETPAEAKASLVALNPGLAPDMISLRCGAGGAVEEMRVCLDKGLHFRPCGADQADSCPSAIAFPPAAPP